MAMASKQKKDPLSRYFTDLDEFDISSGEESEADEQTVEAAESVTNDKGKTPIKNVQKPTAIAQKLPSAHDCLSSQSSPAFLRLAQPKEVDWDRKVKILDQAEDDTPLDFKSNAVPPPTSYEPVTDPGIKVVDEEGNKRKRIGDDLADQMTSTKAYRVHKEDSDDT